MGRTEKKNRKEWRPKTWSLLTRRSVLYSASDHRFFSNSIDRQIAFLTKVAVVKIHMCGIMLHKQDFKTVLVVVQGQKAFHIPWHSAKESSQSLTCECFLGAEAPYFLCSARHSLWTWQLLAGRNMGSNPLLSQATFWFPLEGKIPWQRIVTNLKYSHRHSPHPDFSAGPESFLFPAPQGLEQLPLGTGAQDTISP